MVRHLLVRDVVTVRQKCTNISATTIVVTFVAQRVTAPAVAIVRAVGIVMATGKSVFGVARLLTDRGAVTAREKSTKGRRPQAEVAFGRWLDRAEDRPQPREMSFLKSCGFLQKGVAFEEIIDLGSFPAIRCRDQTAQPHPPSADGHGVVAAVEEAVVVAGLGNFR